jgi:hypothetical protein
MGRHESRAVRVVRDITDTSGLASAQAESFEAQGPWRMRAGVRLTLLRRALLRLLKPCADRQNQLDLENGRALVALASELDLLAERVQELEGFQNPDEDGLWQSGR